MVITSTLFIETRRLLMIGLQQDAKRHYVEKKFLNITS